MRVVVIDRPDPVISVAEAKMQLRVNGSAEDTLIAAMIEAATQHLDGPEGWLGRAIGQQTLELRLDTFRSTIRLPFPPAIDLLSVTYLDREAVERPIDLATVDFNGVWLAPLTPWPVADVAQRLEAVRVRYLAGYEQVPAPIKAALLLMVGDLYRNRETTAGVEKVSSIPMSMAPNVLLEPYRVYH